jgi:hypothetical protein
MPLCFIACTAFILLCECNDLYYFLQFFRSPVCCSVYYFLLSTACESLRALPLSGLKAAANSLSLSMT